MSSGNVSYITHPGGDSVIGSLNQALQQNPSLSATSTQFRNVSHHVVSALYAVIWSLQMSTPFSLLQEDMTYNAGH